MLLTVFLVWGEERNLPGSASKNARWSQEAGMATRSCRLGRLSAAFASLLLLLTFATFQLNAQMTNVGRISGTVTDTAQAVIPGATITVTSQDTGLKRTTTTDPKGYYVISNLPVGTYSVTAKQTGFGNLVKSGYRVDADGRVTVDFSLKPGTVNETVEVSAAGETVNTTSGEVSHVIDQQQVQDMALNGRNYVQLVSLVPGVALLNDDAMAQTTSLSATSNSVNGNRGQTNLLTVDGGFDLDSGSNGSQINNVGVDFVQEVKIETSNFSAEYGRQQGGAIDVVTRSGGDRFHGAAWEYLRNDKLDATNYFSPTKQKLRYNNFGWNFGGPIKKGKLFFFGGEEWKRIRQEAAPVRRTLPTSAELAGDFSGAGNPLCMPGQVSSIKGNTVTCKAGQTIPGANIASMITPNGMAIAKLYQAMQGLAASFTDAAAGNNAIYQDSEPFNWREDILRVDYNLTNNQTIYVRYLHDNYVVQLPFGFSCSSDLPACPQTRNRPGTSYQLSHTWIVNNHLVNDAKLNASWDGQRIPPYGTLWERSQYGFNIPYVFADGGGRFRASIPGISFGGICGAKGTSCPSKIGSQYHSLLSPTTDIAGQDTVTWTKGGHTFKFGALIVRNRKDQNSRSAYAGQITFSTSSNSNTTGNALADALLGNFQDYQESSGDPIGFFRYTQYHFFVDDTWHVFPSLTLDLGMRYERHVPAYTTLNNFSTFDPALYDPSKAVTVTTKGLIDTTKGGDPYNGMIVAGSQPSQLGIPAGAPRGLYPSRNAFAPRLGFSWAPFSDGKTAVRGGFGIFYDTVEGNLDFDELGNPPFAAAADLQVGNLADPSAGKPPASAPISINAIDPNLKLPYTESYSLSVQHEFPKGLLAQLSYVGNQGRHMIYDPDVNQVPLDTLLSNATGAKLNTNYLRPYKGYAGMNMFLSTGTSNYNGLQAYIAKRKGRMLFTGSYTFSKVLTDAGGGSIRESSGGGNIEYATMRNLSYGPAGFDRRHIFVATYSYQLPKLEGWNGFVENVLGGWEFSGITRVQSGSPFTIQGSTAAGTRRADYLGGNMYATNRGPDQWLNPDAFATAPDTRLGNAGNDSVYGPSLYTWDLSLRKVFNLHAERYKLRVQGDFFNAFNRVNFHNPNSTITSSTFGQVSSAGPPREIQLGMKFSF